MLSLNKNYALCFRKKHPLVYFSGQQKCGPSIYSLRCFNHSYVLNF